MKCFPVPGAVPRRVMSWELIVVGIPCVELGMSLMTVSRPKSGLRCTADWRKVERRQRERRGWRNRGHPGRFGGVSWEPALNPGLDRGHYPRHRGRGGTL